MLVGDLSARGDRTAAQRPDLAQLRLERVEIGGVEQPAHLKLQVGIDIVPVKSDCALELRVVNHGRVSRCGKAPEIRSMAARRARFKNYSRACKLSIGAPDSPRGGYFWNLRKSGVRRSMNALRPSMASSVR